MKPSHKQLKAKLHKRFVKEVKKVKAPKKETPFFLLDKDIAA